MIIFNSKTFLIGHTPFVCLEWFLPETKGTRIYKSISLLCWKAIVAFYIVIGYVNCLAKMCIIDEDTLHYTICWGRSHFMSSHFMSTHFMSPISCQAISCPSHFMSGSFHVPRSHFMSGPFHVQAISCLAVPFHVQAISCQATSCPGQGHFMSLGAIS